MHPLKNLALALVLAATVGCATRHGGPGKACQPATEPDMAALFSRWNDSLQTGEPRRVVENYAEESVLLPTLSDRPRFTAAEKEDYFHHFLEDRPAGRIDSRQIQIGCNMAVDTGLYTFTFAKTGAVAKGRYSFTYRRFGDRWLIVSHHSSLLPGKP